MTKGHVQITPENALAVHQLSEGCSFSALDHGETTQTFRMKHDVIDQLLASINRLVASSEEVRAASQEQYYGGSHGGEVD